MLKLFATEWTAVVRELDQLSDVTSPATKSAFLSGETKTTAKSLERIGSLCEGLRLSLSASYAKELAARVRVSITLHDSLSGGAPQKRRTAVMKGIQGFDKSDDFTREIQVLRKRVDDELAGVEFLSLSSEETRRFSNPHPFGEDVEAAFPSAIYDIEEASKCLALERPTASAFHSMRAAEIGLRALMKAIDVPYAPSWESLLKQLRAHIEKLNRSHASQRVEFTFYSEVAAQVGAIKDAWRNPVMHPVSRHSLASATDVFESIRMFMRTLAERIRESTP